MNALKISTDTLDAEAMFQELLDYEIQGDERANDRYGAFKVGTHDDLVTALGLAVLQTPDFHRRLSGIFTLDDDSPGGPIFRGL